MNAGEGKQFRSPVEREAWRKAKSLSEFHWSDLVKAGTTKSMAQVFIRRWEKQGWIEVSSQEGNSRRFRISGTDPQGYESLNKSKTPHDAMWIVMTRLALFTVVDLAEMASVGTMTVSRQMAGSYCKDLLAIGYLRVCRSSSPGYHSTRYQLVQKTGPNAPVIRKVRGLFDANTGEFHPTEGAMA